MHRGQILQSLSQNVCQAPPDHVLEHSPQMLVTLIMLYMLYYLQLLLVNCAVVSAAGLCEALCQKCYSDLCCCFSCFCAGPERAVHTTRDGSPCSCQPDPSHREERYDQAANTFVCLTNCLSVSVRLSPSRHLRLALMPRFACRRRVDVDIYAQTWIQ